MQIGAASRLSRDRVVTVTKKNSGALYSAVADNENAAKKFIYNKKIT
jgi:hypothetical protein